MSENENRQDESEEMDFGDADYNEVQEGVAEYIYSDQFYLITYKSTVTGKLSAQCLCCAEKGIEHTIHGSKSSRGNFRRHIAVNIMIRF